MRSDVDEKIDGSGEARREDRWPGAKLDAKSTACAKLDAKIDGLGAKLDAKIATWREARREKSRATFYGRWGDRRAWQPQFSARWHAASASKPA
jgi:hypothetical protein